MVRTYDDAIFCNFSKNETLHKNVQNIGVFYCFNIIKKLLIFLLHSNLVKRSSCLEIEVSFSNASEILFVNSNDAVDQVDNFCKPRTLDQSTMMMPGFNVIGSSIDTAVHGALSTENSRNEALGTNRIDIEISGEKRKQDWFLPESDAIKTTLYGISGQCQTYNERISYDEEMQPLDLSSKKKQKTTDLREFENKEWIKRTHTSIIFEYSDKFLIQNKYFNKYIDLELNHVKYNITDLTKTNVDAKTFEIFLFVLRFGYD
ncbi:hypothetical protein CWI37_1882p0010, partial [Hamiltosporidium tvaerminnensis]